MPDARASAASPPTRRGTPWTAFVASLALGLLATPGAALGAAAEPVGSGAPVDAAVLPLEGTSWRLTEARWDDAMHGVGGQVAARVSLLAGKVRGWSGCHAMRGRYATVGARLRIDASVGGDGGCGRGARRIEEALLGGLDSAVELRLDQAEVAAGSTVTRLTLLDGDGIERLRFEPDDAGSLALGEWRLERYLVDGAWIEAAAEPAAVLTFAAATGDDLQRRSDGQLIGSTGCNGVVAGYAARGSAVTVRDIEVTDAPCTPGATRQEAAILEVLRASALSASLPPDHLLLGASGGPPSLDFVSASALEGTTWLLARVPGMPRTAEAVTLHLEDGRLSGEGACGRYEGRYETDGRRIRFRGLDAAPAGCRGARRQRALVEALGRAVLVERARPGLRLLDAFGRTVARFSDPSAP